MNDNEQNEEANSEEVNWKFLNDTFAALFLRAAEEIRQFNKLEEDQFQLMSRAHNGRGREHFVYRALDEIEKIGFFLVKDDSFPGPVHFDDRERRLLRNLSASVETEQSLYIRQLVELLAHLICFGTTNSKAYFDHYLLYMELNQLDSYLRDTKKYFGAVSSNQTFYRNALVRNISWGESRLDLDKCWYLKKPKPGGEAKVAPFGDIFPKAISLATNVEKAAMGLSYGLFYGDYSNATHLGIGQVRSNVSFHDLRLNRMRIFYLCLSCLRRISKLCGMRARKGVLPEIATMERQLRDTGLFKKFTKPDIGKGDFVVAGNSLCEVISVIRSEFGYRSFKLKYLSKPPISEIEIDWFPAHQVRKFSSYKQMLEGSLEMLTIGGEKPKIAPRHSRKAMREAVLSTWELITKATRP